MAIKRNIIVLAAFAVGQALQIIAATIAKDLAVSNGLLWTVAVAIIVTVLVGLGMVVAMWNSDICEAKPAKKGKAE